MTNPWSRARIFRIGGPFALAGLNGARGKHLADGVSDLIVKGVLSATAIKMDMGETAASSRRWRRGRDICPPRYRMWYHP